MKDETPEVDTGELSAGDIKRLLEIMARLRNPEGGCPWDVEQTFETIVPYTIEEAYEVADAIGRKDMRALRDELGDLLLQVVFHARMAEEAGHFDFEDVVQSVSDKMIRRHPHVFGGQKIETAEAQTASWEALKAEERAAGGDTDLKPVSVLDGVANALPALLRAEKLQKRAARVGFDWPEPEPVFAKILEEVRELNAEKNTPGGPSPQRMEEEMGDLLFAVANLARHLGLDPETALRLGNDKFEARFRRLEADFQDDGLNLAEVPLDEMEARWQALKNTPPSDAEKPLTKWDLSSRNSGSVE